MPILELASQTCNPDEAAATAAALAHAIVLPNLDHSSTTQLQKTQTLSCTCKLGTRLWRHGAILAYLLRALRTETAPPILLAIVGQKSYAGQLHELGLVMDLT